MMSTALQISGGKLEHRIHPSRLCTLHAVFEQPENEGQRIGVPEHAGWETHLCHELAVGNSTSSFWVLYDPIQALDVTEGEKL